MTTSSGSADIHQRKTDRLPPVSLAERARMLLLPPTPETHRRLVGEIDALAGIEVGSGRAADAGRGPLRIGYWNVARFNRFGPCCRLIERMDCGALLLGEVDIGMARSGQRHALRDAAAALDADYIFGAEYLELGLGDAQEREEYAGQVNEVGLHGNGILSRLSIGSPALIRLETDGDWFDGRHGERRVGGRCAVAATLRSGDARLLAVSVHLESHSSPESRAEQMRRLFAAIDRLHPAAPVVIGGDLNTSTLTRTSTEQAFGRGSMLGGDPQRFLRPERYEPLFRLAEAQGYDTRAANAPGPTERVAEPARMVLGRIDWFLLRGLRARETVVVEAVDDEGRLISDHDAIAVTVETAD